MNKHSSIRLFILTSVFIAQFTLDIHAAQAAGLNADTSGPVNSTFVIGASVQATFKVSGLTASQATSIKVVVADEFGNTVTGGNIPITADSSGNASLVIDVPTSKYGYFRINASLADGSTIAALGTRPAGFISYVVVPDPASRTDYGAGATRFGMEFEPWVSIDTVIPYLGVRWLVSSAGQWSNLENNYSGQFAVNRAKAHAQGTSPWPVQDPDSDNIILNGSIWQTYSLGTISRANWPTWAGTTPNPNGLSCWLSTPLNSAGQTGLPSFASAFGNEVATDYPKPSLHYYQVTWEWEAAPVQYCANGASAQQMVQDYKLAYSELHAADPKAVVVGPTNGVGTDDTQSMSAMLAAGFGNYVDAISYHPYAWYPPEQNSGGSLLSTLRQQNQMVTQAIGHSLPFVITEFGYTSSGGTEAVGAPGPGNELNQAYGDIRQNIIMLGEGSQFNQLFTLVDYWWNSPTETANTWGAYWNLDPNDNPLYPNKLGPKPLAAAFAAMTYMLDGSNTYGLIPNLLGTQMGYSFQQGQTHIVVLWDYGAASSTLNLPTPVGTVKICNWMGNCSSTVSSGSLGLTLGSSPTYIFD